ncbi:hypothetical protein D3C87_1405490 [compost metagenome]
MKASFETSKPSKAPERSPPWLPTSPPKKPDNAPASHARQPWKRNRSARPLVPIPPTKTKMIPKMSVSDGLEANACSKAPAKPPAALVKPKLIKTRRSMCSRRSQNRYAVATKWGTATAATASLVPTQTANSGVNRLPMPKPEMAAIAPATSDTRPTSSPWIILL